MPTQEAGKPGTQKQNVLLDLVEIPATDLLAKKKSPTDVYIKLSAEKYVRLIKVGDIHVDEIASKYLKKSVSSFYIQRKDVSLFSSNVVKEAVRAITSDQVSDEEKVKFISTAATSVYRELEKIGFSQQAFDNAKVVTDGAVSVVKARSDMEKLLLSLEENKDPFVKHSMAVSMVSVLMAQVMGWDSAKTLGKLALGAFLHDIGHMDLPPDSRGKAMDEINDDGKEIYRMHAKMGEKILSRYEEFPPEILAIVQQHHENAKQTGYPEQLPNHSIHPMAKIVAVADVFCEQVFANNQKFAFTQALKVIDHMEKKMGQPFDKEAFAALKKMITEGVAS